VAGGARIAPLPRADRPPMGRPWLRSADHRRVPTAPVAAPTTTRRESPRCGELPSLWTGVTAAITPAPAPSAADTTSVARAIAGLVAPLVAGGRAAKATTAAAKTATRSTMRRGVIAPSTLGRLAPYG